MLANAVLRALRHIWKSLEPAGVPMAVMGGIGLAAWECFRATKDVDLLVGVEAAEQAAALKRMTDAGIRPKRQPPVLTIGETRIIQLQYEPPDTFIDVQIDLLLAESEYHRMALSRRIPAGLPGLDTEIFVLSCEDLILFKLIAGRIIDRVDSAALVRENRATIDCGYLLRWSDALSLTADLREIWAEAFPGESLPSG